MVGAPLDDLLEDGSIDVGQRDGLLVILLLTKVWGRGERGDTLQCNIMAQGWRR